MKISVNEFKKTSENLIIKVAHQDQFIDLSNVHGQDQIIKPDKEQDKFNEVRASQGQSYVTEVNEGRRHDNNIEQGDYQKNLEVAKRHLNPLGDSVSQNANLENRYGYLEPLDPNDAEATHYNELCDNLSIVGNVTQIIHSNSTSVASFANFMTYTSTETSLAARIRAKALMLKKCR